MIGEGEEVIGEGEVIGDSRCDRDEVDRRHPKHWLLTDQVTNKYKMQK